MKQLAIITFFFFKISFSAFSQEIPSMPLKDILSQKNYSIESQLSGKGLVLIFHSIKCPFATGYENRIKTLENIFSKAGFNFILVNADAGNSADEMVKIKEYVEKTGFDIPYVVDELQAWTKFFDITKIPEVLLLTPKNDGWEISFRGAIDNNPQTETSVSEKYLEKAFMQVLKGEKPVPAQVRPMGCNIRVF